MNELIARVLSGEADDFERRRLDEWRRASSDNELLYQELAEVWLHSAAEEQEWQVPPAPLAAAIVEEAERRRARVVPLASRRLRRVPGWWWAAAAVLVMGVGLGWERWRGAGMLEFATGPAQTRTVSLADGSVVRLGPLSRLRVRAADQRSTELRGVAFFAVATDSAHPFVVRTEVGSVQVMGTRFELRAGADSLRLVVVEGRVRLVGSGGRVDVGRGGVGRVTGGALPSVSGVPDVWALLDWPRGVLLFQSTPLADVLRELSARFGRPVVVQDSSLARRTVTAWFEDEPLEVVVSTVCAVVGARCVVGDTVVVSR